MDLPPVLVSNEAVSLRQLDLAAVTTWANLPKACQNLYHNIAGRNISLDAEFKELAQAIHQSVTKEGYWANRKLKSKCKNPRYPDPDDYRHKYLRITIGPKKVGRLCLPFLTPVCS